MPTNYTEEWLQEKLRENPHLKVAGSPSVSRGVGSAALVDAANVPLKAVGGEPPKSSTPLTMGGIMRARSQPKEVEGIAFRTTKEANRYQELRLAEKAGSVRNLRRQVRYPLEVEGVKIFARGYYADFVYDERDERGVWRVVVEDAKGYRSPIYIVKRQLMLAIYKIAVRET